VNNNTSQYLDVDLFMNNASGYIMESQDDEIFLCIIMIISLAVCFTTDPTPTVAEDTTDKTIEGYLYNSPSADNNNNNDDKNDQKKKADIKHSCPKCSSHSLTFKGLGISEGKQIQFIGCNDCGFEWQETWTLPNWFWLKSSSPDNHWTSERWDQE
jgi:DNA-directed RNA polymerase subunit M/transcription elongation factor TFIIS